MDDFSLVGRRALVTGSSEGIGRAIALRLARAGAEVVTHGLAANEDAVASEIAAAGGAARYVAVDLAAPGGAAALAEAAGAVDVLVSNVAMQIVQPLGEVDMAAMSRQFQLNFVAAVELIQLCLPAMREKGWGRIVTIGSVQERQPNPRMLTYAALKSAQVNLVESLARQVAADGVTVNNVAPGVILTRRSTALLTDPAYAAQIKARIPIGYFGAAEDVAGAALLLCGDAGRYITGATIPVSGGMHL